MRNVLLAFASLVALSTVASADPLSVAATTDEHTPPSTYVQGGLMAGQNDRLVTDGATAELGRRVSSFAWVHASFGVGEAHEILVEHGSGSIVQGRFGADLMSCTDNGVLCAFIGGDLGMQSTNFRGMSRPPYGCNNDESVCMGTPINDSHGGAIILGRAGLDIGGTHVRWRPGVEASMSSDGLGGVNLTQSLAYRF